MPQNFSFYSERNGDVLQDKGLRKNQPAFCLLTIAALFTLQVLVKMEDLSEKNWALTNNGISRVWTLRQDPEVCLF